MLGYDSGQTNPFSVTDTDQDQDSTSSQDSQDSSDPWGAGGWAEGSYLEQQEEKVQEAQEDDPQWLKDTRERQEEDLEEDGELGNDNIDTGLGTDLDSWQETAAGKEALETGTEIGQKTLEGLFPGTGQVSSGLLKAGVEGATGTDLDTGDNDNDGSKAASGLFKGLAGMFTGSGNNSSNQEDKNFLEKLGLIDKILLLAAASLGVKAYTSRRGDSS